MDDRQIIRSGSAGERVTRRGFVGGAGAVGLGLTTGGVALPGLAAAAPSRGGHLRAGVVGGSSSDNLDPTTFDNSFMLFVSNSIRDHLVDLGPGGALLPGLAESWESTPDARVWRFKLRKDVAFSDGRPLTGDDVIASIDAHRGPATKSAAKGLFLALKSVRAEDARTIVFELDGGNSDFPYLLTDYHVPIVPAKDGKADLLSRIGTGLYALESFEPGVRATLKRNPHAWQTELGFVDEATLLLIADNTARQNALVAGEVDVISRPELKTVRLLERARGIRVEAVTTNTHYTMAIENDAAPFDNLDVRLALRYAVDRKEFVDKVLYGYGTIGNDNPIGPGFKYHDAGIEQAAYDPDKAKFHLKKAGLTEVAVDYHTAEVAYTGAIDASILFQESAARAGIKVNVRREPNDGYFSEVAFKTPFYTSFWGSRPVEDMILSLGYLSDAPWNESRVKNARLDAIVKMARAELDEAKRRQMYADVQAIIVAEARVIVPAFAKSVMALSGRVGTTGQYGADWEMDGGHFVKRWWMA